MTLKEKLEDFEKGLVLAALEQHVNSGRWITDAAASLGITRKNLWEKMLKYNISKYPIEAMRK
jgi:transcriptional regulator with PAS, ATPase and Fis domain